MPLNENAINEILPFAPGGLPEAGDLMPLDEYAAHPMRQRGHQPGIALRELQNREARQATHMAAGLAQFIANRYQPGVKDDGDLDKVEQGLLDAIQAIVDSATPIIPEYEKYELCEFYLFRSPVLRPGFQPAQGGLLENAATRYPEAWKYLQTTEGLQLCTTEAEWQAMTKATFSTLANGTAITWKGIGGAPYFAPNASSGALRLPDLRGMFQEAAGFDALGVGGVHGDGIRKIEGRTGYYPDAKGSSNDTNSGAFYARWGSNHCVGNNSPACLRSDFDSSRVVPASNKNQPRAWGALPCVYLGQPAA